MILLPVASKAQTSLAQGARRIVQLMPQRSIVEEASYSTDLAQYVPDQRQADEILEAATLFFSCNADAGRLLEGAKKTWTLTIWDIPNGRYLVIFYEMTETTVTLHAVKEYSMI